MAATKRGVPGASVASEVCVTIEHHRRHPADADVRVADEQPVAELRRELGDDRSRLGRFRRQREHGRIRHAVLAQRERDELVVERCALRGDGRQLGGDHIEARVALGITFLAREFVERGENRVALVRSWPIRPRSMLAAA